jgi:hypothetical protein
MKMRRRWKYTGMARRLFFQNVNVQIVEQPVKQVGAVGVDPNIGFV